MAKRRDEVARRGASGRWLVAIVASAALAGCTFDGDRGTQLGGDDRPPGEPDAGGPRLDADAGEAFACPAVPACDAPPPDVGPALGFRHITSSTTAAVSAPHHRGRDLLLVAGEPQVAIAKFAYGLVDKDLWDEDVEVWLLRGCGGAWERLGTARTTVDGEHAAVEGVADTGGRVYFEIPADRALEVGRHRLHLSVAGDRSGTDLYLQVAPGPIAVFVSDVDGTLTTSEYAEAGALLSGELPDANPGAPAALTELAARGYLPIYLTARPEVLVDRTRELLAARGFPPGVVQTTTDATGELGDEAAFKAAALARMVGDRGHALRYAFGNTATDAVAYEAAGLERDRRLLFRYTDEATGGRRFDDYEALAPELAAAPPGCAGPGVSGR